VSQDIQCLLDDWKFEPDHVQVRVIVGDDGREKIQMRIDLGLIQMEFSGRPDGTRPQGHESLLEFYEANAKGAIDSGAPFSLSSDDCARLMREGVLYYHRYRAAFHLERYDLVVRDTERNLRLFTFVVRHAEGQRDKIEFDRYRPYVLMMYSRALASQSLKDGDHRAALSHIDDGIKAIRRFLRDYKQEDHETECSELRSLVEWRREVERERPIDLLEKLAQQLKLSVGLEDYEAAARLRDQIRRLGETGP